MTESGQSHDYVPSTSADPRRIVVVGPCAAGKTTLVSALRERGYNARVSGQEHSEIATLWRLSRPDVLIVLAVDIAAVRKRRESQWPEWLHDLQVGRLAAAAGAADLTIDTTELQPQGVVERVMSFLEEGDPG